MEDQTKMLSKASDLDAKLRHLIPPAVRQDVQELKNVLQNQLMEEFGKASKCDEMLDGFLKQYGLPTALHNLSGGADLPADIWGKIEAFQKKGGKSQFDTVLAGCDALKAENQQMIA